MGVPEGTPKKSPLGGQGVGGFLKAAQSLSLYYCRYYNR